MSSQSRISDVFRPWARRFPDRLAVVDAFGRWTYQELFDAVNNAQAWLGDLDVRPGDRVLVVCENCRALVAILMALSNLDAWPVLVNARASAREVDDIRNHCDPRLMLFTTKVSAQVREHAHHYAATEQDIASLGSLAVGEVNRSSVPEPIDSDVAQRVAALIYTSGSTGLPKGVMLTHKNLLFVARVSAEIRRLTQQDRIYGVLPISHAVGLSVVLLGSLLSGCSLYLVPRFDPVAVLTALQNEGITILLGVPSMFGLIVEYARMKGLSSLQFPALRIISSSGAPLPLALKSDVEDLFGLPLHNGYGVTECSPNIAQTCPEDPRADESVGKAIPGVEVKIAGNDGAAGADGGVGELSVRGPNVMKGYYRDPAGTANAIDSQGWFNTRDLACIRDENLFIVGRTKELIVRFGFNVYPAEVEAVLNAHQGVARAAITSGGVKSSEGGEEIIAFIQLHPGSAVTVRELEKYLADRLAPYKRPSQIVFTGDMPLSPTGKIMKDALQKMTRHT